MKTLVVEDETKIKTFLKRSFEAECFAVDVSADGEEGLNLALINDYDIVILDNKLPGRSGLDICRELLIAQKNMPILILSVTTDTDIKVRALDAGADDYLTKPFLCKSY